MARGPIRGRLFNVCQHVSLMRQLPEGLPVNLEQLAQTCVAVVPIMRTRKFPVLVLQSQSVEMGVECSILLNRWVVKPAIKANARPRCSAKPTGKGKDVVVATLRVRPKDSQVGGLPGIVCILPHTVTEIAGAAMCRHASKQVWILQRQLKRPISSLTLSSLLAGGVLRLET